MKFFGLVTQCQGGNYHKYGQPGDRGDQGDLADNLDDLGDDIAQSDYIGRGHLCDLGDDQHQTARWQLGDGPSHS